MHREEYCFLQPRFILPEFLIHVHFPSKLFPAVFNSSKFQEDHLLHRVQHLDSNKLFFAGDIPTNMNISNCSPTRTLVTAYQHYLNPEALFAEMYYRYSTEGKNGKRAASPQRNSTITKQSALVSIEKAVEEFHRQRIIMLQDTLNRIRRKLAVRID